MVFAYKIIKKCRCSTFQCIGNVENVSFNVNAYFTCYIESIFKLLCARACVADKYASIMC